MLPVSGIVSLWLVVCLWLVVLCSDSNALLLTNAAAIRNEPARRFDRYSTLKPSAVFLAQNNAFSEFSSNNLERGRKVGRNQRFTRSSVTKLATILLLILQNSGLSLTMRLSHAGRAADGTKAYISSTAVVCSEMFKFLFSSAMYFHGKATRKAENSMYLDDPYRMEDHLHSMVDLSIPSFLYVIQNNLQYLATGSLPAAVYQVLVQMKLVTTALFAGALMKTSISSVKWTGIVMLTLGVVIVQLAVTTAKAVGSVNIPLGLSAVALSCVTSAYAGVHVERALKQSGDNMWLKNMHLSFVGLLFALGLAAIKDGKQILRHGFFSGYSPLVMSVIGIHAAGGIIVSLVVTQTDSIVKGFATSGSIILTALLSALVVRDVKMSWQFAIGTAVVCLATLVYSLPSLDAVPGISFIRNKLMLRRPDTTVKLVNYVNENSHEERTDLTSTAE